MSDTIDEATAWLAKADPDPEHARAWITSARRVILPLGVHWSAILIPEHQGLTAATAVTGPVIHDPAGRSVYFLVAPTTKWTGPGQLLGAACWMTTPIPSVVAPPGIYWVRPPDGSGHLVGPEQLATALTGRPRAEEAR